MTEEIDKYVSSHYEQWVNYARYHVRVSGQMFAPEEVVNDILCALLGKNLERVERLIRQQTASGTGFDFFVMRIIKINIYSPRSPFRYQRGQHCTERLDDPHVFDPQEGENTDQNEVHVLVGGILANMNLSDRDERLFVWKFFDRRPISRWPGNENRKELYDVYNRIWKQLIIRIREKLTL